VQWHPANPGVMYRSLDKKWWCADEKLCLARVAAAPATDPQDIAAMYRALDQVWADLEANGWRL
jgi:hypothetical protein